MTGSTARYELDLPRAKPATTDDIIILARTIWGEARGEALEGQIAVAWVVKNRARIARLWRQKHGSSHPLYGDGTIRGACLARWQFSCWNHNDPNRARLLRTSFSDRAFCRALSTACNVWSNDAADPVCGSTHYHHHRITPHWARGQKPVMRLGAHVFYNNIF